MVRTGSGARALFVINNRPKLFLEVTVGSVANTSFERSSKGPAATRLVLLAQLAPCQI